MVSVAAAAIPVRSQRPDLRGQSGVRQSRADALRNIECGSPARHVFDAAIGQFYMNIFGHDNRTCMQRSRCGFERARLSRAVQSAQNTLGFSPEGFMLLKTGY